MAVSDTANGITVEFPNAVEGQESVSSKETQVPDYSHLAVPDYSHLSPQSPEDEDHKITGLLLSEDKGQIGPGILPKALMDTWEDMKNFMSTGDEKSAFRLAATLATGGVASAERGAVGVFGGKGISGGKEIQAQSINEISDVLVNSLKNKQPVPKEIRGAIEDLKQSAEAVDAQHRSLLPNMTKKELDRMGLTLEQWKAGMIEDIDREVGPTFSLIKGGKPAPEPIKAPVNLPDVEKVAKDLKKAQDDFAKDNQALKLGKEGIDPETTRLKGILYDRTKDLVSTLNLIKRETKNDISGVTPIAESLKGRVEFFRDQIAETKYKLAKKRPLENE